MESGSQATEQAQANAAPLHCRANCGFYGNQQYDNYCSKCFKDVIRRKQDTNPPTANVTPAPAQATTSTQPGVGETAVIAEPVVKVASASIPLSSMSETHHEDASPISNTGAVLAPPADQTEAAPSKREETSDAPEPVAPAKSKSNRCLTCRKKVGLTGFGCRCGGLFCSLHRYADAHNCSFDYKTFGQEELRKKNPGCVSAKIEKI